MKIFLINPPVLGGVKMVREGRCMQREGAWTAVWAPISLATIAAILEKEGFEVKLEDCIVNEISFSQLQTKFIKFKPDLVVINTATPSIVGDLKVAVLAKKANQKCKTAAFGIHVSALPAATLKMEKDLDIVVRGEPEMTIKELASDINQKKNWKKIKGISFRQGNIIIHNPPRPFIKNLDILPFPAWQQIKIDRHVLPFKNVPFLLVSTSRGCPFQCRFCASKAFYGDKLRLRSPEKVVDEMEWVLKKFGVKDFLFWAESFTLNREFSLAICREILKRKQPFRWVCNSRVDTVDQDQLNLFKKAGCWMIGFGMESGDDGVLGLMKKQITVAKIKKAVLMAKKAKLEVTGHLIVGFPGETEQTVKKTIKLATDLDLDFAQFYTCVPFPGSEVYAEAKKRNYLTTDNWSFFEQNFSVMDLPNLSAKRTVELRDLAFRRFYLRPRMILKTLKRINSFKDFASLLKTTRDFLNWT